MRLTFRQTHLYRFVNMVRPTRFERATYRVGVCHSIQLSYERIFYCPYSITDTRRKVKQKNGGLHFEGKLVQ